MVKMHKIQCRSCGAPKKHKIWIKSHICGKCVNSPTTYLGNQVQLRQLSEAEAEAIAEENLALVR